jgi:hypothetical protein
MLATRSLVRSNDAFSTGCQALYQCG